MSGSNHLSIIHRLLRHHYILRRSVVVITDVKFSSPYFADLANSLTTAVFEKLNPTDHFGYIQLHEGYRYNHLRLELKANN